MSTTRQHDHSRRSAQQPTDLRRPQYVPRCTWEQMSPMHRAAAQRRAAGAPPAAEHAPDGAAVPEASAGLSADDLAILRPLGKLATVHDMAEQLALPTPPRTRTAEEADR